jgi:serine/threonine-protein kinase
MLTWDGHVKLGDFGIAKARTMADPSATRQVLLGKKHYMSPEQLMGLPVDPRSDVFSMGVVLFELFALRSLFTEDETMAAFDEVVLNPSPDLTFRLPDADPGIQALIAMAIAKDPADRPNAATLGRELDSWCARRGTPGSPERLQAHLAELFPESYKPPTRPSEAIGPVSGPSGRPG